MIAILVFSLMLLATPAYADMFQDASNAKLPEARAGLGLASIAPKDYGAICNGASHLLSSEYATLAAAQAVYPTATSLNNEIDGVAISRAFDAARDAITAGRSVEVIIGQVVCLANTSIDATMLRSLDVTVDFTGSRIDTTAAGLVAFDTRGSQRVKYKGININSPVEATRPLVGFAVGRYESPGSPDGFSSSDSHSIYDLRVTGYYTTASVLNVASEQTTWVHPFVQNRFLGGYAYIADGISHFSVPSTYLTITLTPDSPLSFIGNTYIGGEFRHQDASPSVWMSATTSHAFQNAYILSTGGDHVVDLYSLSAGSDNKMLSIRGHAENGNTDYVFMMTGPNTLPRMSGFEFINGTPLSNLALFKADTGITKVRLYNTTVKIRTATAGFKGVDQPALYTISGDWLLPDISMWNYPEFISGQVCFADSGSAVSSQCLGDAAVMASRGDAFTITGTDGLEKNAATVPFNRMEPNAALRVTSWWDTTRAIATNSIVIRIRFAAAGGECVPGTTCTAGAVMQTENLNAAGEVSLSSQITIANTNDLSNQVYFPAPGIYAANFNTSDSTIPTNAGANINFNCLVTVNGDVCTLRRWIVEYIPGTKTSP